MKLLLEETPNLDILQAEVTGFLVENGRITGVENQFGDRIPCRAVVVTTGTFLNGKLHYGMRNFPEGGQAISRPTRFRPRFPDSSAPDRTPQNRTPPRILAKTIDFPA